MYIRSSSSPVAAQPSGDPKLADFVTAVLMLSCFATAKVAPGAVSLLHPLNQHGRRRRSPPNGDGPPWSRGPPNNKPTMTSPSGGDQENREEHRSSL
ncbi:hypothetical protein BDA96_02G293300 [Sorghum bicolor]|uniref:Uncharacterized protein n=2 Tax=Sorghum bicolor TaxID=4558 RepID=A0A921RRS1_SORBI|nr:hypothetical protein BDA96_04G255300 [Sorghum bicolor]KAG0544638.1 hypothetical protein BDA96_02G293300 [Sorghum bicolor]KXG30773.1 hypothetical protein SORBI_3004G239800 [Sorghum bicolor]KXG36084.1 hypothetical protein SORBI_3002G278900 [Sorghum bicolor]OQU89834.1 hypothetical protein SORBI_3002G278900 [Sorghum bicolor]